MWLSPNFGTDIKWIFLNNLIDFYSSWIRLKIPPEFHGFLMVLGGIEVN